MIDTGSIGQNLEAESVRCLDCKLMYSEHVSNKTHMRFAGADIHTPGTANFTATAPKVALPAPLHSLHVHANATAQWAVMVSTGQGMAASYTESASSTLSMCREYVHGSPPCSHHHYT